VNAARQPKPAPVALVALVIGSGGLRCVSAFGALAVLQREGIKVDMVVACSGGAVVGYWIASGGTDIADGIARYKAGMAHGFDRLNYRQVLSGLFPRLFGYSAKFGLMKDGEFNRYMAQELNGVRFEDLAIPLHCLAADVHSGEQVVLSSGPVFDALRASLALPLLLPPWQVNGRLLMDGGVCNPLPVDVAMREGADIILAMGFEDPLQPAIHSGAALVRQVLAVATNHLLRAQFAFHTLTHHAEVVAVLPDFDKTVGLRDLHLIPYLVRQGELAMNKEVPYLRRLLQQRADVANKAAA
jgi:NTE family protein